MPGAAPRDWNKVSHIGFRRIFASDEWPSSDSSLVIMFSLEDLPTVVLAVVVFPHCSIGEESSLAARAIVDRFVEGRVFDLQQSSESFDAHSP